MSAPPRRLQVRGRVLELGGPRPALMGIVNATPDSFSDGGELPDLAARLGRARELHGAGATWLDVGGASAAGGLPPMREDEECERVVPVIEGIVAELDAIVSVDTHRPAVAAAAVAAGAHVVNDVSGLRDERIAELCARTGAGLVVMHTTIAPGATLLDPGAYRDVAREVTDFLEARAARAVALGVKEEQLLLDPGPDFAKTPAQTVSVLRALPALHGLGRPLLLALSRKDFLGAITGRPVRERGAATLAAVAWAVRAGAHLLRVHDVAAVADLLAVSAVLDGEHELGELAGLTPDRYPATGVRPGSYRPD